MAHLDQLLQQGLQAHQKQNFEQARVFYNEVLTQSPEHAEAHHLLGALDLQTGASDSGLSHLKKATELAPAQASYWNNLGLAYQEQRDLEQAINAFKKALKQRQAYPEAQLNLAHALRRQEAFEEALQHYQQALHFGGPQQLCFYYLGTLLDEMGRLCEAAVYFQQLLAQNNYHADAWGAMASNAFQRGEIEQAMTCFYNATQLQPDSDNLFSAYIFAACVADANGQTQLPQLLQQWGQRFPAVQADLTSPRNQDPEKRLRIAYVGSHFNAHSSAHITRALFEAHSAEAFELFIYNNGKKELTADNFYCQYSKQFYNVRTWSDEKLAEQIHADEIDCLVDLNGHTQGHRLSCLTRRLAPVQITGLGFGCSSGQQAMDAVLADPWIIDAERRVLFTEKHVPIHSTFCWYAPDFDLPVNDLPALHRGHISFGSGNRWFKNTPTVLKLWADILHAVPDSHLYFKTPELDDQPFRDLIYQRFEAWGIARERLHMQGRTDKYAHFQFYQQIDIALDPFPYGGGISLLDSLWMGVPCISLRGGQRASVSILSQLELAELLVDAPSGYVNLATQLAQDLESLQKWRQSLRQRLENSTLCQPHYFTASVEAAYRQLWQDWVKTQPSH